MGRRSKVFLILGLFFLAGLAAVLGLAFHYYNNPSKLKHLAEDALSVFSGAQCSIKEISYDRKPRTVRLRGIDFIEPVEGFHLEIPEIAAVISVSGGVGQRSLVLENLQVNGFTLTTAETWRLPRIAGGAGEISLFRRILGGLFSFFVFQDVRVHEAGLIDGHVTARWGENIINVEGLRASLTRDRFFEASCGLHVRNPAEGLDLSLPRLTWSTDQPVYPPGPTVRARLEGEEVAFEAPWARVDRAILQTSMVYRRQEKQLVFESFTVASDEVTIHGEDASLEVSFPFLVEAKAVMDFVENRLSSPSVTMTLGDLGEFRGGFEADLSGSQGFTIELFDLSVAAEKLIAALPTPMGRNLGDLALAGPVHVGGRVAGNLDQPFGSWRCDFRAGLKDNRISFASPGALLNTDLAGDVQVTGTLFRPEILVNLYTDASRVRVGNVEVEKGRFGFSVTGVYPVFRVKELSLTTDAARFGMGGRKLLLEKIDAQTRSGGFDLQRRSLNLPELSLQTSTLKNLIFSVEMTEDLFSAALKGEEVNVFEFCQAMGFLPRTWSIQAADSLQGLLVLDKDGLLKAQARLQVRGLTFESEDGNVVGENLSFVLEPAFEGPIEPQGKLTGTVSLSSGAGEILYDRFYLDLAKHPLALTGKGGYESGAGSLDLSELRFRMKELAAFDLKGTWAGDASETSRFLVHVPRAPIGPVFRQFLVEPYKHQNPFLAGIRLEGFFSLDLEVSGAGSLWTVTGRSLWQEGAAATEGQGIAFQGIELDLPIWYRHGAKGAGEKAPAAKAPQELEGSVFIDSARLPLLPPQPVGTRLKAGPDGLHTLSPMPIVTRGGQIEIGRITFREPFRGTPDIQTTLVLEEIDLEPWLSRVWPNPIKGTLRGSLDPVQWRGEILTTQGQITADLFEGDLIISNIGAKRFPSLTPVITFDAAWTDLDLGQMTGDTAFGKIQGTLKGHAKGFEMADGQPQAFDLFMETVKKPDIPQRISVQAVDNIAQIGGGASPFSGLAGAFVSFFRELPYEKIGISAVLENDVFRINGTIRENNREYLIKKGGFSGVDVIIGSPGSNTISFKDMVRRIKRVTGPQEGPVIE
jgi:hypothetical protein